MIFQANLSRMPYYNTSWLENINTEKFLRETHSEIKVIGCQFGHIGCISEFTNIKSRVEIYSLSMIEPRDRHRDGKIPFIFHPMADFFFEISINYISYDV